MVYGFSGLGLWSLGFRVYATVRSIESSGPEVRPCGLELAGALAGGSPPHNAAGDSPAFV